MKARIAVGIAILLAVMLPLAMVAQTDTQPAPSQGQGMGQMGPQHEHMGAMGGPMNAEARLEHLSRMLNLTDDQKATIKPILEKQSSQMQSLRQDTSLSPQDRHTKVRDIQQNANSQIRAVLTPDQQAKLDQMKQRMGKGKGMGMGHGEGQGMGQEQQPSKPPQE